MKRFIAASSAVAVLALPQIASAQAPAPVGNNPTTAGIYVEGVFGLNLLDDIDLDIDGVDDDAELKSKAGGFGAVALGYSVPLGPTSIRAEGELGVRGNQLDEFNGLDGVDDSVTSALSAMANAHLDVYVLPNLALSAGAGVGYAKVSTEIVVDAGAVNAEVSDDSDNALAYQGRLGARYDLAGGGTITGGYTYFATDELEVADNLDVDATFEYVSHTFHVGFAYRF